MGQFQIRSTITNKSGHILSSETNSYTKTHPLQFDLARYTDRPNRPYLHAEVAALLKIKKGMKPYKITIERYHKDGTPALAKPCDICEQAIKRWGIKRVEYTL